MKCGVSVYHVIALLVFFSLCCISSSLAADVHVIALDDDTINPVTAEYIIEGIDRAEEQEAACLVIKLDTPGGLLNSTRKIVKAIMAADIPVVIYISPGGSRAGSAGVFITYSGHIAAMAPSTNIGAAHPVQMGGKGRETNMWDALKEFASANKKEEAQEEPTQKEKGDKQETEIAPDEDPMSSKILNDTVAFIKSLAEKRGRNPQWAVESVVKSDSITEQEALEKGVIDLIAQSDRDLLKKIHGCSVMINDQEIVLDTQDADIRRFPMDARQQIFNILANPNVAYILMILGFYGLLYEITHPGIGVPGIAGAICLILAFFSMQTLPTNFAGLALVVIGLLLFIAEAMAPGLGLLTLGGAVSMILGSLLLFETVDPFMKVSLSLIIAFTGTTAVLTLFLIKAVISAHRRKAVSGSEGIVGERGEAKTKLTPGKTGKVFVHGELWNAETQTEMSKGTRIVVESIDGMILHVKSYNEGGQR